MHWASPVDKRVALVSRIQRRLACQLVGGPSGNTTGQTTLPSIINSSGTLSITWIKGTGYPGVYGSDYLIETTTTMTGTWTPETVGVNVTLTGNNVTYTFPATSEDRRFVRLKVMAP
jgi:hypothetical protein